MDENAPEFVPRKKKEAAAPRVVITPPQRKSEEEMTKILESNKDISFVPKPKADRAASSTAKTAEKAPAVPKESKIQKPQENEKVESAPPASSPAETAPKKPYTPIVYTMDFLFSLRKFIAPIELEKALYNPKNKAIYGKDCKKLVRWEAPKRNTKNEKTIADVRSTLNKITNDNFSKHRNQLLSVDIDDEDLLKMVISVIYEKAVNELKFSEVYSTICDCLAKDIKITFDVSKFEDAEGESGMKTVTDKKKQKKQKRSAGASKAFITLLRAKCMSEFEQIVWNLNPKKIRELMEAKCATDEPDQNVKIEKPEGAPAATTAAPTTTTSAAPAADGAAPTTGVEPQTDPYIESDSELTEKHRKQSLGNIIFIGSLFLKDIFKKPFIDELIEKLFSIKEEFAFEALCKLIDIIGKEFDSRDKNAMTKIFDRMKEITQTSGYVSQRIKFMFMDISDKRGNQWSPKVASNILRVTSVPPVGSPAPPQLNIQPPARKEKPSKAGGFIEVTSGKHAIKKPQTLKVFRPKLSKANKFDLLEDDDVLNDSDSDAPSGILGMSPTIESDDDSSSILTEDAMSILRTPSVNQNRPPERIKDDVANLVDEYMNGEEDALISFNEFHEKNYPTVVEGICEHLVSAQERGLAEGAKLLLKLIQKDCLDVTSVKVGLRNFMRNCDEDENVLDCTTGKVGDVASALVAACICNKKFRFNDMDVLYEPLRELPKMPSAKYGVAATLIGKTLRFLSNMVSNDKELFDLAEENPMNIKRFFEPNKDNDETLEEFLKEFNGTAIQPKLSEHIKSVKELEAIIKECYESKGDASKSAKLKNIKAKITALGSNYPRALELPTTCKWLENTCDLLFNDKTYKSLSNDSMDILRTLLEEQSILQNSILELIKKIIPDNGIFIYLFIYLLSFHLIFLFLTPFQ